MFDILCSLWKCFSVNHEHERPCISPLKHLVKCILAVMAETLEKSFSIEDFERSQLETRDKT